MLGKKVSLVRMSKTAKVMKLQMDKKIQNGTYQFDECLCFCMNGKSILLSDKDRYGNYYPIVLCEKCGLIRANPRLTKNSYADFYHYEYRSLYGDEDENKEVIFDLKVRDGFKVYKYISSSITISKNAVVFDVGCDAGAKLVAFRQNGCQVAGTDYGETNIIFGRNKTGFDLRVGGVEQLRAFGKKADLIVLDHVFEHMLDLESELQEIKGLLNDGGYVYVAVPGTFWWIEKICDGNIMGVLQNAHVWQFSLESLTYVMEVSGFKRVSGDEKIVSIFQKVNGPIRHRGDVPYKEKEKVLDYLLRMEKEYLSYYWMKRFRKLWQRVFNRKVANTNN